jgi:hypothetical protein
MELFRGYFYVEVCRDLVSSIVGNAEGFSLQTQN